MADRLTNWLKNQLSLDTPEQDFISPETAGDFALGLVPGVGTAMSVRDIGRAVKAKDPVAGGLAAIGLLPFGRLAGTVKNKIIAGINAKNAPMDSLLKGRTALKKGVDPEQVWQEHGVFKGYDKGVDPNAPMKWEIPDTNAKFKNSLIQDEDAFQKTQGRHSFTGRLDDLLEHPELFENYPHLRDMNVDAAYSKGVKESGVAWPDSLEAKGRNPDQLMKVLLHEIQHNVQSTENFGRGGNTDYFAFKLAQDVIKDDPSRAKEFFRPKSPLWKNVDKQAMDMYMKLPGEVESRSVELRKNFPPEMLRQYSPRKSAEVMGYGPENINVVDLP